MGGWIGQVNGDEAWLLVVIDRQNRLAEADDRTLIYLH